ARVAARPAAGASETPALAGAPAKPEGPAPLTASRGAAPAPATADAPAFDMFAGPSALTVPTLVEDSGMALARAVPAASLPAASLADAAAAEPVAAVSDQTRTAAEATVLVHYALGDRARAAAAATRLRSAGFGRVELREVPGRIVRTSARFFHAGDRGLAPALSAAAPVSARVMDLTHHTDRPAPGTLELWIAG
ncbi:MAG: hypothetical protein AAF677_17405, partial [Pseudomonadota bacterium]